MQTKNELLADILGDLSLGEQDSLQKEASNVTPSILNTEDLNYPGQAMGSCTKSEKKLGLAGLGARGGEHEDLHQPYDGKLGGSFSGGTEDIKIPNMRRENPTLLEKKASIYQAVSEAAGLDLTKIAESSSQEDFLIKEATAMVIDSSEQLEKIAYSMADAMADRFLARVNGVHYE